MKKAKYKGEYHDPLNITIKLKIFGPSNLYKKIFEPTN